MKIFIVILSFLFLSSNVYASTCSLPTALEYQFGPYTESTMVSTSGDIVNEWNIGPLPTVQEILAAKASCNKAKVRDEKIAEVKAYGESLWQDDFPGVTFGAAKLVRQSIVSMITGINAKSGIGLSESDMSVPIQNLNDVWTAGAADVAALNNYTGLGSVSAHDSEAWWP